MTRRESPFTPGKPVPVDLFVGRSEQITELTQCINQTLSGKQENVFLIGDRGVGKSSAAEFFRSIAEREENMLGVHVFLGGATDIDDVVCRIFEKVLVKSRKEGWFGNISNLFGKYVREVGLFGLSVSFNPPRDRLRELTRMFPDALQNILKKLEGLKTGILIVLDDIDGVASKIEFANWYKSFVDEAAIHYTKFRVFIMFIGLHEVWNALLAQQPSLIRIFRIVQIERLSRSEVEEFFSKAFNKIDRQVDDDAMNVMVTYSDGLPILMHEIGDATFWYDEDGVIDEHDALGGVFIAAERVGRKYLNPRIYHMIKSQKYRSILRKLAIPTSKDFTRKGVSGKLNESEKRVLADFLRKMKKLGIIEQNLEDGRGAYRFVNRIYPLYIWIESEQLKERQKLNT